MKPTTCVPASDWEACRPVYETFEGWHVSTRGARSWANLPATAIKYVKRLEELIEWALPAAEEIGAAPYLAVPERNAAERQIERVEEGASLEEIYAEQVRASETIRD